MEGLEVAGIQGSTRSIDSVRTLCTANGVPAATDDFDELCALDIDTVYIAVPNFLHFAYCRQALEKGLNVIVEKPMTSNLKEALYLQKLAKSKGLFLFEAITTLYLGNYQKIQEWLPQIGEIKLVQSQYSQYSSRYDSFRAGEILPAFDANKSGGALMDLNLYNLHYVMGLFGRPEEAAYYANIERNIDTSGMLVMKYPDFLAICIAAKDCKGVAGGVIQGTKGCIKSKLSANLIGEVTLELNDGTVEKYDDGGGDIRVVPEFTAFIKAINANDLEFCYRMLDKSVAVSEIQTMARLKAGIHFPADEASVE
jgi:predicted dehydrogenase